MAACTAKLQGGNRSGVCWRHSRFYRCDICETVDPLRKRGAICEDCRKMIEDLTYFRDRLGLNDWSRRDPAELEARLVRYTARAELGLPLFGR